MRLSELQEKHIEDQKSKLQKKAELESVANKKKAEVENFRELVRESRDLENELQQLVNHL